MISKSLEEKYKNRLEKELHPSQLQDKPEISYSRMYQLFKKDQMGKMHTMYEQLCNESESILKLKLKPTDKEKIEPFLRMAHINTTVQGVYSFATLITLIIIISGFAFGMLLGNLFIIVGGLLAGLIAFFGLPEIPKNIFQTWRAKASDQIIMAVLYMIIYMEHTPNLELAVWFAAKHLPPPLSLDFMKVLWNVETKKHTTIGASLEEYVEGWRGWDNEFIESIHLIEGALAAPTKKKQLETLEKAENVILQGTQDHMMAYAHNLQSPISTLHMLGIVLPVMGLVMLPMVSAFMGDQIKWWYLLVMFNIILPIVVYAITKSILKVRPAGSNPLDSYMYLKAKYDKPYFSIGNFKLRVPAWFLGVLVFTSLALPAILYFVYLYATLSGEALRTALFATPAVFFSIILVAAAGFGLATYYFYKVKHLIKARREVKAIESEFSSAIFQLGNRIGEGIPVEAAFAKVIEAMPKAKVTQFFRLIDYNIRQKGMSLKEAILNEKYGAIAFYPSALITSVMHTLIDSAKKGPHVVASSMTTISKYMQAVHRVNERLKDLLADTISSLSMQTKLFAPMITGIVVGLAVLTTNILLTLGDRLTSLEYGADTPGFGAGLLTIFQIEYMTPGPLLQIIVGVYLVQIVVIMSILLSGIVNGLDPIEQSNEIGKNLFLGTAFYIGIASVCTLLFLGLVGSIVGVI